MYICISECLSTLSFVRDDWVFIHFNCGMLKSPCHSNFFTEFFGVLAKREFWIWIKGEIELERLWRSHTILFSLEIFFFQKRSGAFVFHSDARAENLFFSLEFWNYGKPKLSFREFLGSRRFWVAIWHWICCINFRFVTLRIQSGINHSYHSCVGYDRTHCSIILSAQRSDFLWL